jgi:hypothetical protein
MVPVGPLAGQIPPDPPGQHDGGYFVPKLPRVIFHSSEDVNPLLPHGISFRGYSVCPAPPLSRAAPRRPSVCPAPPVPRRRSSEKLGKALKWLRLPKFTQ